MSMKKKIKKGGKAAIKGIKRGGKTTLNGLKKGARKTGKVAVTVGTVAASVLKQQVA